MMQNHFNMKQKPQENTILTTSKEYKNLQFCEFVKNVVCKYYNIDDVLRDKSRKRNVVIIRQISTYLMRTMGNVSYSTIAKFFGLSHSTLIHGAKTFKGYLDWDKDLQNQVKEIQTSITVKAVVHKSKFNINSEFYFIDLTNFHSVKMNEKSLLFAGYTDEEVDAFLAYNNIEAEKKTHYNTHYYILEDRFKKLRKN